MSRPPSRFVFWLTALAVFPLLVTLSPCSLQIAALPGITRIALLPREPRLEDLTARVSARLVEAEFREPNAWYRDDYRIARVTLGLAPLGSPIPHVEATYHVLGVHPDQVWPRIMARRIAMLGSEAKDFFGGWSSPKKPVRSVGLAEFRRRNDAA